MVYQTGTLLATQALVTVLEGIALVATLFTVLAAILFSFAVMSLLTAPALFGPLAEAVRFGVQVWLGNG